MTEYRVTLVGAWTTDGLARNVKAVLTEHNVDPERIVTINHARGGIFWTLAGNGPFSALVVWNEP